PEVGAPGPGRSHLEADGRDCPALIPTPERSPRTFFYTEDNHPVRGAPPARVTPLPEPVHVPGHLHIILVLEYVLESIQQPSNGQDVEVGFGHGLAVRAGIEQAVFEVRPVHERRGFSHDSPPNTHTSGTTKYR